MPRAAFTAPVALWRAAAPIVTVETVGPRGAELTWSGAPGARFTVQYGPAGTVEARRSRRCVARPRVALKGLRPGVSYDVSISGGDGVAAAAFRTMAVAGGPEGAVEEAGVLTELSRLEIRVGRVVECARHPDADSLYVEHVDVGEEGLRTIVSGLVKFVPLENMVGRSVLVLCNLKPRTMRGVTSQGMLLCASNEDHTVVDPLAAPEGVPCGELVTFEGHKAAPIDAGNRATKSFDRIAADLRTSADGVAMYRDVSFSTSAGPCVSPAKVEGSVS